MYITILKHLNRQHKLFIITRKSLIIYLTINIFNFFIFVSLRIRTVYLVILQHTRNTMNGIKSFNFENVLKTTEVNDTLRISFSAAFISEFSISVSLPLYAHTYVYIYIYIIYDIIITKERFWQPKFIYGSPFLLSTTLHYIYMYILYYIVYTTWTAPVSTCGSNELLTGYCTRVYSFSFE